MSINISKKILFNLFVRGISACLKLFFLLYIARVNGNVFVGEYSLIMSVTGISIILLGFEIHSGFGRIIHNLDNSTQKDYIGSQLKFYITLYLISIPLLIYLSIWYIKLNFLTSLILAITICIEHLTLELFRILITKLKTREAIIFNFIKSVPFILILILLDYFNIVKVSIFIYILFWLINNILSIFLLFTKFKIKNILPAFKDIYYYDYKHFMLLANESKFYFLLSIIGSITSNFDKIILSKTIGLEKLGIYFALLSFGSIINIFLSYTIGMHQGPIIVKDFAIFGYLDYIKKRVFLLKDYFIYSFISSIIIFFVFLVSNFLKITNYNEFLFEFVLVIFSIIILAMSEVYKMDIYLAKHDKVLFKTTFYVLIISISNIYIFSSKFGIIGATTAIFINSIIQLLFFIFYSNKSLKFLKKQSLDLKTTLS
jgi:O-antigen/teichoic acid export membrane protein